MDWWRGGGEEGECVCVLGERELVRVRAPGALLSPM